MAEYKIMYAVVGITTTKVGDQITSGPSFIRSVHSTSKEAYSARVEMDDRVESFITKEK